MKIRIQMQQRAGFAVLHDSSITKTHQALGVVGDVRLVGDQHDGDAFVIEGIEQCHDLFAGGGVQIAGGLIGQDQARLVHQGTGNRHALALTTGQLRRLVLQAMTQADALERGPAPFAPEVKLTTIRGLHMRRGVGGRSSDIVVLDPGNRLVAVVSSKWTWRSDRGTEAAQMVPLRQYRPDVPYTLVTSEFPRARSVAQESIEDRSYHLCPGWVGAWEATRRADNPRVEYPSLVDLRDEGSDIALNIGLRDLDDLISDLSEAGTIL